MHILVVEDSEVARESLEVILGSRGHWVKAVKGFEEARAAVVVGPMPDLALIDYYLPGGTGVAFLEFLRTHHGEAVPAIIMTAADDRLDDIRGDGERLGGVSVISKPFDPEALIAMIENRSLQETR